VSNLNLYAQEIIMREKQQALLQEAHNWRLTRRPRRPRRPILRDIRHIIERTILRTVRPLNQPQPIVSTPCGD
jgi:hypothetical protein